jgi:hypothetical protein
MKNLFIWWHVRRTAHWLNFRAILVLMPLFWGPILALCYGLKFLIPGHPLLNLIFGAVICGVAALIFLRTPAIAKSDKVLLTTLLRGREALMLRWLGLAQR